MRSSLAEIKEHAESLESALSAYEQSAESKGQSTAENDVLLAAELDEVKELLRRSHGIDFGDYTALVKSSKQFVQMRKTICQKNDQLKQLRKRLMIYEPDDTEVSEKTLDLLYLQALMQRFPSVSRLQKNILPRCASDLDEEVSHTVQLQVK